MSQDIKVSELLCTKLCHDLAGPVGAVDNGIDFLDSDNPQIRKKAHELVKLSSKQAVNRLIFFRQAYGNIAYDTDLHLSELKVLILKYIEDSKLQLIFADTAIDDCDLINGQLGKLLLNLVVISVHAIMSNGLITITAHFLDNQVKLEVSAEGNSYKLDGELINIINWQLAGIKINSRNIQYYYTALLLQNLKSTINVLEEKNKVIFTVTHTKR